MNIEYYERGDLTSRDIEYLRDVDVNMDDWDYILIIPDELLEKEVDYNIEKLLTGMSHNTWHKVMWKGKECSLGVAYHA